MLSIRHWPPMFSLQQIRKAVLQTEPCALKPAADLEGRASVAVIFAGEPASPCLCFIQRASRRNDPWSGHMAFPGGRSEPEDSTPRSIAERETMEEVCLSLDAAEYIGPLSELWIRHSGIVTGEVLAPFVYYAGPGLPALSRSDEVAESYWIPVNHLWTPANHTTLEYDRNGTRVVLPGIRYRDQIIWGLTYMMLCSLGDLLDAPLPSPEPERL